MFFNPAAGDVGNLPVMAFDGPPQFRMDLALSKRFRFADRYSFEFKAEAFNLTNTPSFFRGDMNINSTTFGRITGEPRLARDPVLGTVRLLNRHRIGVRAGGTLEMLGPPFFEPVNGRAGELESR